MSDEITAIADNESRDVVEVLTKDGSTRTIPNGVAAQRDRLRIMSRQWLMERWSPQEYAPPNKMELTGAGGGPVLLEQLTLLAMKQIEAEQGKAEDLPVLNGPKGETER